MKALEKFATARSTMPILNAVLVNSGRAYATDLDNWLVEKTTLADGLYSGVGNSESCQGYRHDSGTP